TSAGVRIAPRLPILGWTYAPMTTEAAAPSSPPAAALERGLIPQPERPSQFPIRVPVVAECGGAPIKAEVIGSTGNVLLLQTADKKFETPALGTPIRIRVDWDRQLL